MQANIDRVQVAVRSRPLSSYEKQYGESKTTAFSQSKPEITLRNPRAEQSVQPKTFCFDSIYDSETTQEDFYQSLISPAVNSVLQGQGYTILTYGKTAVGKTYTILGKSESQDLRGIAPRACEQIFKQTEAMLEKQVSIEISCVELFSDQLKDLFASESNNTLELRESKSRTIVKDLSSVEVKTVQEAVELLQKGRGNRSVPQKAMNIEAYGGHLILTIYVHILDNESRQEINGQLRLVDLAGSERLRLCGVVPRLNEIVKTNGSLQALEQVISALANPKTSFVPYRNSKLTRLLQDSLEGPTKLILIANISPAESVYTETLATLKVAQEARKLNARKKAQNSNEEKTRKKSGGIEDQQAKIENNSRNLIE